MSTVSGETNTMNMTEFTGMHVTARSLSGEKIYFAITKNKNRIVKPRMSLLNRAVACSLHLIQNPILLITPITGHVRRLSLKKGMGNFATSSDIPELLWCLGVVGET